MTWLVSLLTLLIGGYLFLQILPVLFAIGIVFFGFEWLNKQIDNMVGVVGEPV